MIGTVCNYFGDAIGLEMMAYSIVVQHDKEHIFGRFGVAVIFPTSYKQRLCLYLYREIVQDLHRHNE